MAYRDVILADRPTAYWPLQQSLADVTGNGHDLTGTPTYYEGALPGREEYHGVFGGTSLTRANHDAFNRLVYSLELWIKPPPPNGSSFVPIMSKGNGGIPGRAPGLWINPSLHAIHTTHEYPGGQTVVDVPISANSGSALQDAWIHYVVTQDGSTQRAYVNGELRSAVTNAGAHSVNADSLLVHTNNMPLDEIAYYPYVLTADKVAGHYEAGLTSGLHDYGRAVMQDKPIAYWGDAMDSRYHYDTTHNSASVNWGNPLAPDGVSGLVSWLRGDAVTGRTDGQKVVEPGYADLTFTMGSVAGNQYSYYAITSASVANYAVVAGDVLEYETWVVTTDKITQVGIDLVYSDGNPQRAYTGNPNYNQAPGSWIKTTINIAANNAGKTISTYMIFSESDATGTHNVRIREARITNGGFVKVVIYANSSNNAVALATSTSGTGLPGSTAGSSLTANTGVASTNYLNSVGGWVGMDRMGAPVYKTGGINGKPYFQQQSSGTGLEWPVNYSSGQPFTIFGVARMRQGVGRIFSSRLNNWLFGWHNSFENEGYFEGWVYGANDPAAGSLTNTNVLRAFTATFTGTSTPAQPPMWKDGTLLTPRAGSVGHTGFNVLITTGYLGVSELSDSDVYEVIVYNRVLSNAEIINIHGYLANKYGQSWYPTGAGFKKQTALVGGPPGTGSRYIAVNGDHGVTLDAPRLRMATPSTIEMWLYPTVMAGRQGLWQKTMYHWEGAINYEAAGEISAYWGDSSNGGLYMAMGTGATKVPVNQWSHLVVTRNTSWDGTEIWLNGQIVTSSKDSAGGTSGTRANPGMPYRQAVGSTGNLTWGYNYTGTPFQGRLADMAMYHRVLSPAAIRDHYLAGLARRADAPGYGGYGG